MTICIVGPGAIGLLYYFHLAKKVKDITILDKDRDRARRLTQKGLTVLKENRSFKVPLRVTSQTQDLKEIDLFIGTRQPLRTKQIGQEGSLRPRKHGRNRGFVLKA